MKVLLINPPTYNMITHEVPSFVDEERGYNPPLGLLYVAAYAEKFTEHKIEVLDCQVEELSYEQIARRIKQSKLDMVGIQALTFTLIDAMKVAGIVKEIDSGIKVVMGGIHADIYPIETISIPEVDYLVVGEGEVAFAELLNNLDKDLSKVKGIVYKENGKVVRSENRGLIEDLDNLPFPARHLTPYNKYTSLLAKRNPITTMFTSRGCPYRCTFCNREHLGKKFRGRSANNVIGEMEECIERFGIKEFLIYDDLFTANRQRTIDISQEIINRGLDTGYDIRARVNTIDEEVVRLLSKSGCERIHFGVESPHQNILDILKKGITLEQVERAFKFSKKYNISTLAYFMIGNPTETKEQILQTIDYAKKLNPDYVHFSVLTPFPATELYKMGLDSGLYQYDYWRLFAQHPHESFVPEVWNEILPREELVELLEFAYKSFYARSSYVAKSLFKVRSLGEFKRKAKAGLKLIWSN